MRHYWDIKQFSTHFEFLGIKKSQLLIDGLDSILFPEKPKAAEKHARKSTRLFRMCNTIRAFTLVSGSLVCDISPPLSIEECWKYLKSEKVTSHTNICLRRKLCKIWVPLTSFVNNSKATCPMDYRFCCFGSMAVIILVSI